MKYVNNDGNVIYHEDKILQNWESAFKKLCTNPNGNFDDLFYNLAILHKTILKNNSMDPGFTPNDMLKINNPVFFLFFFNLYIPARFINVLKQKKWTTCIWRKVLTCPIPKKATIDSRIPLNYRGISPLSVVAKWYCSVLNNRVQHLQFLE